MLCAPTARRPATVLNGVLTELWHSSSRKPARRHRVVTLWKKRQQALAIAMRVSVVPAKSSKVPRGRPTAGVSVHPCVRALRFVSGRVRSRLGASLPSSRLNGDRHPQHTLLAPLSHTACRGGRERSPHYRYLVG